MMQRKPLNKKVVFFETANGKKPFHEWFNSLKDRKTRERIGTRLLRLEAGNLGDHRSVGEGIHEMRLHFGPGYRIYFAEHGNCIIVVLAGGTKKTQQDDIKKAQRYFSEFISN